VACSRANFTFTFTPVLCQHLLQVGDISVAGPYLGKMKHSVLVALMAKHCDDDDDDTSRGEKSRKHEESFVGILFHLYKISSPNE
jgi:hypothetical protein